MATSIRPVSIARDVAELMKANRRVGGAIAASQVPVPAKDRLVISTNGQPATWQLSAIPDVGDLGSSLNLSLNGVELDEATDYSVDYTTGLVTFSSAQQALFRVTPAPADVLTADYLTSDDLTAQTLTADAGLPPTFKNATTAATTGDTSVTSLSVTSPTCTAGDLLLLAFQVNSAAGSGTPSGWTLVASVNSGPTSAGDSENYYLYTKTATSTDAAGTTYSASSASTTQLTIACLSYTPGSIDMSATNGSASGSSRVTSWNCPTVTVSDARTIVEFWAEAVGSTNGSFSGPGSPATVRADAAVSGGSLNHHFSVQRVVDEPQAAAGTTTARTVTCGIGGGWASITVALSP